MVEMGLSEPAFLIGTACHLIPWKRVDLIINAFALWKIPNKKLIICRGGPEKVTFIEFLFNNNVAQKVVDNVSSFISKKYSLQNMISSYKIFTSKN